MASIYINAFLQTLLDVVVHMSLSTMARVVVIRDI